MLYSFHDVLCNTINNRKTKVKLGNYMLKPKLVKAFTVHGIAKWNFDPF